MNEMEAFQEAESQQGGAYAEGKGPESVKPEPSAYVAADYSGQAVGMAAVAEDNASGFQEPEPEPQASLFSTLAADDFEREQAALEEQEAEQNKRYPWDDETDRLNASIRSCLEAGGAASDQQACLASELGIPAQDVQRNWAEFQRFTREADESKSFDAADFRRRYPYTAQTILMQPEMVDVALNNAGIVEMAANAPAFAAGAAKVALTQGLGAFVDLFDKDKKVNAVGGVDKFVAENKDFLVARQELFKTKSVRVPKAATGSVGFIEGTLRSIEAGRLAEEDSKLGEMAKAAILADRPDVFERLRFEHEKIKMRMAELSPVGQGVMSDTWNAAMQSAPGTISVGVKGALGAVAGAAVGAGAGALAGGAGAVPGAIAGAKYGATAGAAGSSFVASRGQQLGGNVWEMLELKSDDGKSLNPTDAVIAASRSADIGAAVEAADSVVTLLTAGGMKLASAATSGVMKQAVEKIAAKAASKGAARTAVGVIAAGGASEAVEEVAQFGIQHYYEQKEKERVDRHAQSEDYVQLVNDIARTAGQSFFAGALFSGGTVAVRTFADSLGREVGRATTERESLLDGAKLQAVADHMAKVPDEAKQGVGGVIVANMTWADGAASEVIRVPGTKVQEFFQMDGKEWRTGLAEVLGDEVAAEISSQIDQAGSAVVSVGSFVMDFASVVGSDGRTMAQHLAKSASVPGGMSVEDVQAEHSMDEKAAEAIEEVVRTEGLTDERRGELAAYAARMSGKVEGTAKLVEEVSRSAAEAKEALYEKAVAAGMDEEQASAGAQMAVQSAVNVSLRTGMNLVDTLKEVQVEGTSKEYLEALAGKMSEGAHSTASEAAVAEAAAQAAEAPAVAGAEVASAPVVDSAEPVPVDNSVEIAAAREGQADSVSEAAPETASDGTASVGEAETAERSKDKEDASIARAADRARKVRSRMKKAASEPDPAKRAKSMRGYVERHEKLLSMYQTEIDAAESASILASIEEETRLVAEARAYLADAESELANVSQEPAQITQDAQFTQEPAQVTQDFTQEAEQAGQETSNESSPNAQNQEPTGQETEQNEQKPAVEAEKTEENGAFLTEGTSVQTDEVEETVRIEPETAESMADRDAIGIASAVPADPGDIADAKDASVELRGESEKASEKEAASSEKQGEETQPQRNNEEYMAERAMAEHFARREEAKSAGVVKEEDAAFKHLSELFADYTKDFVNEKTHTIRNALFLMNIEYGRMAAPIELVVKGPFGTVEPMKEFRKSFLEMFWAADNALGINSEGDSPSRFIMTRSRRGSDGFINLFLGGDERNNERLAKNVTDESILSEAYSTVFRETEKMKRMAALIAYAARRGIVTERTTTKGFIIRKDVVEKTTLNLDANRVVNELELYLSFSDKAIKLLDAFDEWRLSLLKKPSGDESFVASKKDFRSEKRLAEERLVELSKSWRDASKEFSGVISERVSAKSVGLSLQEENSDAFEYVNGTYSKVASSAQEYADALTKYVKNNEHTIDAKKKEEFEKRCGEFDENMEEVVRPAIEEVTVGDMDSYDRQHAEIRQRLMSEAADEYQSRYERIKNSVYALEDASKKYVEAVDASKKTYFQKSKAGVTISQDGYARAYKVLLSKDADASSIVHETAHVILDAMQYAARQPTATKSMKEAWSAVSSWLKVEDGNLTTEQQERFASQFELFLNEGESELGEPGDAAMDWSKQFLRAIWERAGLKGKKPNPEADAFFQSVFTGDDTIYHAADMAVTEMMSSALAVTPPSEIEDFMKRMEAGAKEASRSAEFADMRKEAAALGKEEQEKASEIFERNLKEIRESIGYRLRRSMITGEYAGLDIGRWKLDRGEVMAELGLAKLPEKMAALTTRKGGLGFETIAAIIPEAAQLGSLRALVHAIAEAPNSDVAGARRRAKEEFADYAREHFQQRHFELEARAERAKFTPALMDEAFSRLRQLDASAPARADIELAAAVYVEDKAHGELKFSHWNTAAKSAHRQVMIALAPSKGGNTGADVGLAAVAQQKFAYALSVSREIVRENREYARDERTLRSIGKPESLSKMGQADNAAADVMATILEAVGKKRPPEDASLVKERKTFRDMEAAAIASLDEDNVLTRADAWPWDSSRLEAIVGSGRSLGAMKVADRRYLMKFVRWLDRGGTTIRVNGVAMPVGEAARLAASTIPEVSHGKFADKNSRNVFQKVRAGLGAWELRHEETKLLFEKLGDVGVQIWDDLTKGDQRELELSNIVGNEMEAIFKRREKAASRFREKVELPDSLPTPADTSRAFTRQGMVAMALNTGNDGNLQRLVDGWGWKREDVFAFLDANMTRDDWGFVQDVWDLMDSVLYPAVSAAYREANGVQMSRVPAVARVTDSGVELRGGYYPVFYDRDASSIGDLQRRSDTVAPSVSDWNASVRDGFTKSRANAVAGNPLDLSLDRMFTAIQQQVRYAAKEVPVHDMGKLLNHSGFAKAVKDAYGADFLSLIRDDVMEAYARGTEPLSGKSKVLSFLNGAFSSAVLGWNFPAAIGDVVRPFTAAMMGEVGMLGVATSFIRPVSSVRLAEAKSAEFRLLSSRVRGRFLGDSYFKALGPMDRAARVKRRMEEANFLLMETVTKWTASSMWSAKYSESIRAGMDEASAVREADHVIQDMVPNVVDWRKAATQRSDFYRIATVFAGEGIKLYSILRHAHPEEILAAASQKEWTHALKRSVGVAAVLLFYPLASMLVMGRGANDDEDNTEWAAKAVLQSIAGFDPLILMPMYKVIEAGVFGERMQSFKLPSENTMQRIYRGFDAAISEDSETPERLFGMLEAFGPLSGLPTNEVQKIGKAVAGYQGVDEADTPLEVAEAVIYGRSEARGWNAFRLIDGEPAGKKAKGKGKGKKKKRP